MKTPLSILLVLFTLITPRPPSASAAPPSIIQLGLILDASSSTDSQELPVFVQGVANGIAALKTDGTIELTVAQFRSAALVIFGPTLIDSDAVRQQAIDRVLALNPDDSLETHPLLGVLTSGTDIEEGFKVTEEAMAGSPNAGNASLQFINMLTDGHPTLHSDLGFGDIDETARHERAKMFAKTERDRIIAAGIDVISFEALGSDAADIAYLQTLAYPEPAVLLSGTDPAFPDPITDSGFILEIASREGIEAALVAKFEAAGFAVTLPPDPLEFKEPVYDRENGEVTIEWFVVGGQTYQVEYTVDLETWMNDLPNSTLTATENDTTLSYTDPISGSSIKIYRIQRLEVP